MKIALLNDRLDAGGAEKVLVNMANMLHKKGVDVTVVLYLNPSVLDKLINPAIPVIYLHRSGRFDIGAMFRLKKIVAKFDIVHVHSRYNLAYYIVVKFITGIIRPKTVFHEHKPELSADFINRFFISQADAYVAVWQAMAKWAVNIMKLRPSQFYYLANVINPPATAVAVQPAGFKIISVGNYRRPKNHVFAIELLNALPKEYTLDIYGAINDSIFFDEVVATIEKYGLQNRVKQVKNISDIYSVLGNYNVAIHTATDETGPLVLMEYMYAGLPFISYNTGDVVTTIESELPELVMHSFELAEWKSAITGILADNNKRSSIRDKMRTLIKSRFSEESYWNQLQTIYGEVLNN